MDLSNLSDEELTALDEKLNGKKPAEPAAAPEGKSLVGFGHNVVQSGKDLVSNTVQPFIAPGETAGNLIGLAKGIGEKFTPGVGEHEKYADAAGQYFKDRFGGVQNVIDTAYKDPVGLAADVSIPLTMGGSGLARLPGVLGKVGEIVAATGRVTDPIRGAIQGSKVVGRVAGKTGAHVVGNVSIDSGGGPIIKAAETGFEASRDPKAATAYRAGMRGGTSGVPARHIPEYEAGQKLSSWQPQGPVHKLLLKGNAAAHILPHLLTGGASHTLQAMLDPSFWATIPLQIPRTVGEGAYYGGRAADAFNHIPATELARILQQTKSRE